MADGSDSGSSSSDAESSLARQLWRSFGREEAFFPLFSPFYLCYAAGNLNPDTLVRSVTQDGQVLRAFTAALRSTAEYAAPCEDADDEKDAIHKLRSVLENISINRDSFLKESYPDAEQVCDIDPSTVTDFVHEIASGKHEMIKDLDKRAFPAYIAGVVVPFLKLSAFLAEEFKKVSSLSIDQCDKLFEYYSSTIFQESAEETELLLDTLSGDLTLDEVEALKNVYGEAIRLGVEFLYARRVFQPSGVPLISTDTTNSAEYRLLFFSAYENTCTLVDSSSELAEEMIDNIEEFGERASQILRKRWEFVSDWCQDEYEKCVGGILLSNGVTRFDYESLANALTRLSEFETRKINRVSEFETRKINRVSESRLLQGLQFMELMILGVLLTRRQPRCFAFFRELIGNDKIKVKLSIISQCWCEDMIVSSLEKVEAANIHANGLVYIDETLATGEIIGNVETHVDKVERFREIISRETSRPEDDKANMAIYVGHGLGDLMCLLEADIGIVINCSPGLKVVGHCFGISFVPLFEGLLKEQKRIDGSEGRNHLISSKSKTGILYTVLSWAEIHAFVLGRKFV